MSEAEWGDVFNLIDEEGTGGIPTTKFPMAIRAAGGWPTEDEVKTMIEKVDPDGGGIVSKDAFIKQMKWITKVNPIDIYQVGESFKIFDKDENGKISKTELMHIITSMGDKLSTDDADEFF